MVGGAAHPRRQARFLRGSIPSVVGIDDGTIYNVNTAECSDDGV